ncbi:hypothetical protein [uncultured Methanospirillum sp.]|uniref:hypothetical protein n=1 Tax=uncultured Methanospirillum sp. TaxID=262503 RepID=UPI0029C9183A|nr:hypothetical protein [uncultured Methanospirillum sp.]
MNKNIVLTAVFGIIITLLLGFFFGQAAAGIAAVILLTILLAMAISEDAAKSAHPELSASLHEDAETVIVENLGTAPAKSTQVRIIPDDIRYEIGDLNPDSVHRYLLPSIVRNAKAAVSWERKDGSRTERIFRLSGYEDETDPLRPLFPLFNWKEK